MFEFKGVAAGVVDTRHQQFRKGSAGMISKHSCRHYHDTKWLHHCEKINRKDIVLSFQTYLKQNPWPQTSTFGRQCSCRIIIRDIQEDIKRLLTLFFQVPMLSPKVGCNVNRFLFGPISWTFVLLISTLPQWHCSSMLGSEISLIIQNKALRFRKSSLEAW